MSLSAIGEINVSFLTHFLKHEGAVTVTDANRRRQLTLTRDEDGTYAFDVDRTPGHRPGGMTYWRADRGFAEADVCVIAGLAVAMANDLEPKHATVSTPGGTVRPLTRMRPEPSYRSCPSHCCPQHGCKYGHDGCPVATGQVPPEFPANNGCERCEWEAEEIAAGRDPHAETPLDPFGL